MASGNDSVENTFNVSPNIYIHIEEDNFANFYVYREKEEKGFLLNSLTSKALIKYLLVEKDIDMINEILDTLIDVIQIEVEN